MVIIKYILKYDKEKYYTMKEVIEITKLCRGKIHKLCESDHLEYIQSEGKHRFIKKESVYELVKWQNKHKKIPNFPDYTISRHGEIRKITGKQAPKLMTPGLNFDGYHDIAIRDKEGNRHWTTVHRLVALTYLPNPLELPQVNHIDENKLNNHVSNLEWCTNIYNCNYGDRNKKISNANKGKKRDYK